MQVGSAQRFLPRQLLSRGKIGRPSHGSRRPLGHGDSAGNSQPSANGHLGDIANPVRLRDLWKKPVQAGDRWKGPYLDPSECLDPWGGDYVYRSTPYAFELVSYGADGVPGGAASDADVVFK